MTYFLKGKKVGLRNLTQDDISITYLCWINDQEVTAFLETGFFPGHLDELRNYLEKENRSQDIFLGIFDIKKDTHIGNIKLSSINWIHRTAELGILIGEKAYWGQGFGGESVSLLVNHAFQTLNLRKIYLGVYENHQAAINSYKNQGFEIEGILKDHYFYKGKYVGKVYMAIYNKNGEQNG